jgi:spore coat polysaccharide biosynthesis predicted glycosyltransferase SpsG
MGGADPQNYILKVLNNIKNYVLQENIIVNIIIGYSNKNYDTIINFIKNTEAEAEAKAEAEAEAEAEANNNLFIIHFDIDFDKLIAIYLDSDLAIGSLSITAYERLFLKIPQICIKIADNQLIQELDVFNIINISCLMEKLNDYKNILDKQMQYSTKFINQNRFIVYFNDIII